MFLYSLILIFITDTLKNQASQNNAEYNRLATELNAATGQDKSNKRVDWFVFGVNKVEFSFSFIVLDALNTKISLFQRLSVGFSASLCIIDFISTYFYFLSLSLVRRLLFRLPPPKQCMHWDRPQMMQRNLIRVLYYEWLPQILVTISIHTLKNFSKIFFVVLVLTCVLTMVGYPITFQNHFLFSMMCCATVIVALGWPDLVK
jgi:hypothetical protein